MWFCAVVRTSSVLKKQTHQSNQRSMWNCCVSAANVASWLASHILSPPCQGARYERCHLRERLSSDQALLLEWCSSHLFFWPPVAGSDQNQRIPTLSGANRKRKWQQPSPHNASWLQNSCLCFRVQLIIDRWSILGLFQTPLNFCKIMPRRLNKVFQTDYDLNII